MKISKVTYDALHLQFAFLYCFASFFKEIHRIYSISNDATVFFRAQK